jgi:hypothetical protein
MAEKKCVFIKTKAKSPVVFHPPGSKTSWEAVICGLDLARGDFCAQQLPVGFAVPGEDERRRGGDDRELVAVLQRAVEKDHPRQTTRARGDLDGRGVEQVGMENRAAHGS